MSNFKRGDTVFLRFDIADVWNKPLLVESIPYLDDKVDVIYFDTNQKIQRDRFHKDLLKLSGED